MRKNVPLRNYSNYRIGGAADYFFEAHSVTELEKALKEGKKMDLPLFILGGGTNILWSDEGFRGLVLRIAIDTVVLDGARVRAGAGVLMPELVEAAVSGGLSGLEWAGGLPGSFGGAVFGNAGAFGGEIKDTVAYVESINIHTHELLKRANEECDFRYRSSVFKRDGDEIILAATLELNPGDGETLRAAVQEKIDYRRERHPIELPNIGSIFKNVDVSKLPEEIVSPHRPVLKTDPFPIIPTAYLVDKVGLKGKKSGDAQISPKHPNFIVNTGKASAKDVLELIALVKKKVKEELNIELEEEVRIIP